MILQIEPIYRCVQSISNFQIPNLKIKNFKSKKTRIILFSAKGKQYTQRDAKRLAKYEQLILICGRYEGVDERVAKYIADEEISIGDFVLTGGEIPAMIVVDSVSRFLPKVLGNIESAKNDSHCRKNYKEHPQYTKPQEFNKWKVPKVLMSGNHGEIKKWRGKNCKNSC